VAQGKTRAEGLRWLVCLAFCIGWMYFARESPTLTPTLGHERLQRCRGRGWRVGAAFTGVRWCWSEEEDVDVRCLSLSISGIPSRIAGEGEDVGMEEG